MKTLNLRRIKGSWEYLIGDNWRPITLELGPILQHAAVGIKGDITLTITVIETVNGQG